MFVYISEFNGFDVVYFSTRISILFQNEGLQYDLTVNTCTGLVMYI